MKRFELVKREDHYGLYNEDGHKIAATIDGCNSKLSKENCDEIFGVLDVETLSDEYSHDSIWFNKRGTYNNQEFFEFIAKKSFTDGFNKAMELNKDKLFTVEDIKKAIAFGWDYEGLTKEEMLERYNFKLEYDNSYTEDIDKFIQSLQQPKEIEVEIEQVLIQSSIEGEAIWKYRLDENGCLILKKK